MRRSSTFATRGVWRAADPHWVTCRFWYGIGMAVLVGRATLIDHALDLSF